MILVTHRGGTFSEASLPEAHDLAQRLVGGVVEITRTSPTTIEVRGPKGKAQLRAA